MARANKILQINDTEFVLTDDGAALLKDLYKLGKLDDEYMPIVAAATIKSTIVVKKDEDIAQEEHDFARCKVILDKIKLSMIKATGQKQIKGFDGKTPFVPSANELMEFLLRFKKQFPHLWDLNKIESYILQYVNTCHKKKNYSPAIKYFIIKEGSGSQLASFMESGEEVDDKKDEQQHNITNTKDLFG